MKLNMKNNCISRKLNKNLEEFKKLPLQQKRSSLFGTMLAFYTLDNILSVSFVSGIYAYNQVTLTFAFIVCITFMLLSSVYVFKQAKIISKEERALITLKLLRGPRLKNYTFIKKS